MTYPILAGLLTTVLIAEANHPGRQFSLPPFPQEGIELCVGKPRPQGAVSYHHGSRATGKRSWPPC
jgi:hypothetical protein